FRSFQAVEHPNRSSTAPVLRNPCFQSFSPIPLNPFIFSSHDLKEHHL
ncbi:hypothetical protein LINPERHAP1_LOCUS8928, partial [Linum perenne]